MQAKILETVVYSGTKYLVGQLYDLEPEIYNAIYPSARYVDDAMSVLDDFLSLDVDFTKYWTYPMDGYGRLNRFFSSNFKFNHKSNKHLFCGTPGILTNVGGLTKKKILFTMFESDKIPTDWLRYLNDSADVIIVPSNFCKDVFIKSGVTTDIHVLPLFYIPSRNKLTPRSDDIFTFGHQNAFIMGHQKGDDVLMRAFIKAFGDDKDVRLILKGRKHHYQALDHDFVKECKKHKNIEIVLEDYTDDEVYDKFYSRLDCFVFPSRGEGFGMPPLEALSVGIPVIATDGHSLADYRDLFMPIKTKGKCDSYYVGRVKDSENSHWVQIDEKHLVKQLIEMRKNYNDYKYKAYAQLDVVRDLYSPQTFAKMFSNLIGRL